MPFVNGHGAIATQARVNTDLGRHGLTLLNAGVDIETGLRTLLDADEDRERRQLHGLNADGEFVFTGEDCVPWAGHLRRDQCAVAGNMLTGPDVLEAMADAFQAAEDAPGDLSDRLLKALEAGQSAGGDKRGKQSAALLVYSPEPRLYHNLRVDDHDDPVAELRRIYDRVVEHSREIEQEYGPEGLAQFSRIKV